MFTKIMLFKFAKRHYYESVIQCAVLLYTRKDTHNYDLIVLRLKNRFFPNWKQQLYEFFQNIFSNNFFSEKKSHSVKKELQADQTAFFKSNHLSQ